MEEITLNAFERNEALNKLRENGFVPGVIYGDGVKGSTSVKFEALPLKKVLAKHGPNAKIWVLHEDDKKFGFIKKVQRHPLTAQIIHIDVQLVSKDHEIKLQLPITFKGEESLFSQQLQLHVLKAEIHVVGKMDLMPDAVIVDISAKKFGDTITRKNFDLDAQIKVTDKEEEIYAIVQLKKQADDEEVTAEVTAEPEAKAQ